MNRYQCNETLHDVGVKSTVKYAKSGLKIVLQWKGFQLMFSTSARLLEVNAAHLLKAKQRLPYRTVLASFACGKKRTSVVTTFSRCESLLQYRSAHIWRIRNFWSCIIWTASTSQNFFPSCCNFVHMALDGCWQVTSSTRRACPNFLAYATARSTSFMTSSDFRSSSIVKWNSFQDQIHSLGFGQPSYQLEQARATLARSWSERYQ